ncbi:MAG: penicillin-binding protein 2, partial [Candidatus Nealsonbacteria bacterium]|nr:penicillin-binding protein 2 [Candidatus Nealsonbacteria bacterium]
MKNWRINLVLIFISLFGVAILSRLFFLQILQHDFYSALARGQQSFSVNIPGERGKIFFQNHDLPVSQDKNIYLVYASPLEIKPEEKENISEILSNDLGLDKDAIFKILQKDSLYELIKDRLSEKEAQDLQRNELTGIHVDEKGLRDYPYGEFASHILGFVNKDGRGQYGIEEYWDDILSREGSDLMLTIDYNVQYLAEKLLSEAKENLNIDGGTIIVMRPQSGEILALAEYPNFNPNKYYQEKDLQVFQTDAIQKIFEPGSVFKPITMSGALNEGKITPQTTYRDPGVLEINGWPIYNYDKKSYPGNITMTEVLEKSINTGAVFAESQLGNEKFFEYVKKYGIFKKTDIDLSGEILSSNKEFKKGQEVNFATASFGQGIEMTPIQLVRAFSAIANGGKLVKPYLVKEIKNAIKTVEINPKVSDNNIISADTASKLTAMLVSVVENGFGKAARVPGYYIGGKTGTAQVSYSALGIPKAGYSDKTWQSFIGFAPAFSPEFLFISGGRNRAHNIENFGNLYIVEAPFLLLGVLVCILNRKRKAFQLLGWWILISPVAATITKDAPHTNRMFAIFPAISVVVALGIAYFTDVLVRVSWRQVAIVGVVFVYSMNIALYLDRY